MIHELKILPEWFGPVKSGAKKCEARVNDRDYKVGDTLILNEWDLNFTGEKVNALVTHILDDEQYTQPNHIIMSIEVIK
ncbi:DUF3850 domain-containing protein [Orbus sturtevantii]|uniref:DUF3850 domain-containing protein n=1 Tax=Orbus sturtevantii TaxID=3074109 RepID=UPI00370D4E9A